MPGLLEFDVYMSPLRLLHELPQPLSMVSSPNYLQPCSPLLYRNLLKGAKWSFRCVAHVRLLLCDVPLPNGSSAASLLHNTQQIWRP